MVTRGSVDAAGAAVEDASVVARAADDVLEPDEGWQGPSE